MVKESSQNLMLNDIAMAKAGCKYVLKSQYTMDIVGNLYF